MLIRFFAFFLFGLPVAGCCAAGASLVVAVGATSSSRNWSPSSTARFVACWFNGFRLSS
jgi:hypothetical protein